jgi:hypothetical protein
MKSLSLHLIEGSIDQVDGTVAVSWVQSRVLTAKQVSRARVPGKGLRGLLQDVCAPAGFDCVCHVLGTLPSGSCTRGGICVLGCILLLLVLLVLLLLLLLVLVLLVLVLVLVLLLPLLPPRPPLLLLTRTPPLPLPLPLPGWRPEGPA